MANSNVQKAGCKKNGQIRVRHTHWRSSISGPKIISSATVVLVTCAAACAQIAEQSNDENLLAALTKKDVESSTGESGKQSENQVPNRGSGDSQQVLLPNPQEQANKLIEDGKENRSLDEEIKEEPDPRFNSLDLTQLTLDGVLNREESLTNASVVALNASHYVRASYAIVEPSSSCDADQQYSDSMPVSGSEALTDGSTKKICVRISSASGKTEYGASQNFVIDKTPPKLEVNTSSLLALATDSIQFSGTCEAGVNVMIKSTSLQNESSNITCSEKGDFSATLGLIGQERSLNFNFSTEDKAGNKSKSTLSMQRDDSVPSITISGPSVGTVSKSKTTVYSISYIPSKNGIKSISLNSTDVVFAADSAGCQASISDTEETSTKDISITGCTVQIGRASFSLASGTATDGSGNRAAAAGPSAQFNIDNHSPQVSIESPASNQVFNSSQPSVALKGTCETGLEVNLSGDVTLGQKTSCTDGKFNFSNWSLSSGEGQKTIFVTQTDGVGNEGKSTERSFSVINGPAAPTLTIPSTIIGLRKTLIGTCDKSANSHSATSTLGVVQSVNCGADGKLTITLHLPSGANSSFQITATSTKAGAPPSAQTFTLNRNDFFCPTGFVGVPGSGLAQLGNQFASNSHGSWWINVEKDFCVMKYPAKWDGTSNYASSTAAGQPWTNISRSSSSGTSAISACSNIDRSVTGGSYRLISNTQWQTIARNAENVASNWSSGVVGTGKMAQGHTDNSPSNALENSSDTSPYFGTGNTKDSGWEQRRTQILSNGEVIWDFGGNVWQWVSDNYSDLGVNPNLESAWLEYTTTASFPSSGINRLLFSPHGNFGLAELVGSLYGGSTGALRRGGSWADTNKAGSFTAHLSNNSAIFNNQTGFRCVFTAQ